MPDAGGKGRALKVPGSVHHRVSGLVAASIEMFARARVRVCVCVRVCVRVFVAMYMLALLYDMKGGGEEEREEGG